MKGFKFEPVVWLATIAAVLGAVLDADAQYHFLPTTWGHWVAVAVAVVGLVLVALRARGAATPLAAPRAANGRPLVPAPPATIPSSASPESLRADRT